jgi:hypothetical protein
LQGPGVEVTITTGGAANDQRSKVHLVADERREQARLTGLRIDTADEWQVAELF